MKFADWIRNYKHVEFEDVRTPNKLVYCVYDIVTKKFGFPFVNYNHDSMLRDIAITAKNDVNRSKDLSLYHVGYWNEDTAMLQPCEPDCICANLFTLLQTEKEKEVSL